MYVLSYACTTYCGDTGWVTPKEGCEKDTSYEDPCLSNSLFPTSHRLWQSTCYNSFRSPPKTQSADWSTDSPRTVRQVRRVRRWEDTLLNRYGQTCKIRNKVQIRNSKVVTRILMYNILNILWNRHIGQIVDVENSRKLDRGKDSVRSFTSLVLLLTLGTGSVHGPYKSIDKSQTTYPYYLGYSKWTSTVNVLQTYSKRT